MATKKIVAQATIHVPHKDHVPFEFDAMGNRTKGSYRVVEIKPGDTVEIEDSEADALIELGRADPFREKKAPEVQKPAPVAPPPKV